jgi:5-methyltetrahydrofolate--homocysteine methyltransferase
MIIIGERLNSSRGAVLTAMSARDENFLVEQALEQEKAGAAYIDLNSAALMEGEVDGLGWMIPLLQGRLHVPLSIDSPDPEAMAAGLRLHQGQALLNSLSGETKRWQALLPLIREYKPKVIVLCLDDDGMRKDARGIFSVAARLVDRLVREGVAREDILLDPLVHPVGVDTEAPGLFLGALRLIKKEMPSIKTVAGLSNVSFGLPERKLINRTFLTLAMAEGLDAAILDPLDKNLMETLVAAEALLGKDPSLKAYIKHTRRKN